MPVVFRQVFTAYSWRHTFCHSVSDLARA
jgi:hypothetical protein